MDAVALLNQVIGLLVPPSPATFPAAQTLTLSGLASYRMAVPGASQVNNTTTGNKAVAQGSVVTNVLRTSAYSTNTIANAGPGNSGTVTTFRNSTSVGSVALNGAANGTYGGNLIISNNQDYHNVNSSVAAGFYYVFNAQASGTAAPGGWNELYIADSAAGNTNTVGWYYDNTAIGAPSITNIAITPPGSPTLLYSSTVPVYTNTNQFTLTYTASVLSGNTYPTSDTFATGVAGGAFAAPASVTYQATTLGTNVLSANASANVTTTASIIAGTGQSNVGPSMTVTNSYSASAPNFAPGNIVLYGTGSASSNTVIIESNVYIGGSIGNLTAGMAGQAFRIANPGTGNTPTYTGSEAAFNSTTGPLQTYDATVVTSVLKHDVTNYASGYLPVGPNLSSGRTGTQYFTFKFTGTSISKFDIMWSGTIAGLWFALPGSTIDTTSTINGWLDGSIAYNGAGVPGAGSGGNGSNGGATGGTAPLNTLVTNQRITLTFGTVSSTSTATHEIYVRIAVASGQTVTALSLQTASN